MDLVKRAPFALAATLLLLLGFATISSCTKLLGIDTDHGDSPCNDGMARPPLTCGVGACYNAVPACDDNGLPNTCTPRLDQKKDETKDGIDNNCDGLIDEGTDCKDGDQQPCYRSSTLTRNIGLCHDGIQTCALGVWGDCIGDKLPEPEQCDQRDNDCDGTVDNGCPCTASQEQECYGGAESTLGQGACKAGKQKCENGTWGDCSGDVLPSLEVCDGVDNDCNGDIDQMPTCQCKDGDVKPCYPDNAPMGVAGMGECTLGTATCIKGQWGPCIGAVLPKAEVCNGKDDDCNGMADDGASLGAGQDCILPPNGPGSLGPCSLGKTICGPGGLQCQQTVFPTSESCDGLDNNCDGTLDDGNLCCSDGTKNGTETDTDCGGPCAKKCADGQQCIQDFDCQSSKCTNQFCQVPTCNDKVKNGSESDIDCGGACPTKCPVPGSCNVASDCVTGVCTNKVCVGAGCNDGVTNGSESDTDCGGSDCAGCAPGKKCNSALDCTSQVCTAAVCQPPTCNDSKQNGTETDVDCGGSCNKCNIGQKCNVPIDCTSSICTGGTCIAPTCNDLVKNGSETGIDCGGLCPIKCPIGDPCIVNNDCATNVCTNNFCGQKPIGALCSAANECPGNNCVDGVCCNNACTGTCVACSVAKKGYGSDGICQAVKDGLDLDNECADQGASTCGTDGACNGSGACRFYSSNTVCVPASCNGDGVTLTQAMKCDGLGSCNAGGGMTSCAPATCSGGTCAGPCMTDAMCASNGYCKGGMCVSKGPDGSPCQGDNACLSGSCTDGVCCNLPCKGPCEACTLAKQGPGGKGDGKCWNIGAGLDPDNECSPVGGNSCGPTGTCSGFGSCALSNDQTVCNVASCAGDGVTLIKADYCNGSGTCIDSGTQVCAPYACNGNACNATCAGDGQCAPTAYCSAPTCIDKKPTPAPCSADKECQSGHCADGVCCNTACTGTCMACTNAKNGSKPDGTCGAINAGLDPENECTDQGQASCGADGVCDGAGACQLYPAGVTPNQITGDCKENQCDGAGHIVSVTKSSDIPVDNNQCTNDVCTGNVPSNPPTASGTGCNQNGGTVCNGNGACVQCVVASTCPGTDTQCQTRTCINNVCGLSYVAAGTATLSQTPGDCKENQCDGAGNIVSATKSLDVPVDGNQCTSDVCTGNVPSNPPAGAGAACNQMGGTVCNGSGTCVQCVAPSTCPGVDTDCKTRTCIANVCGFSFAASGTATSTQTAGDCKENQCDGAGNIVSATKSTDVPVDGNQCTSDVCTGNVPSNPATGSGTACNQMGGSVCNGSGTCVQCVSPSTCPGMDTTCQTRTCTGNVCGFNNTGSGTACNEMGGQFCDGSGACVQCLSNADCVSITGGACGASHACQSPTCSDGIMNQGELSLDCGGPSCPFCTSVVLVLAGSTDAAFGEMGAEYHPGGTWQMTSIPSGTTSDAVALGIVSSNGVGLIHDAGGALKSTYWTAGALKGSWSAFAQVGAATTTAAPSLSAALGTNAQAAYLSGTSYSYGANNGSTWSITAEATGATNPSAAPSIVARSSTTAVLAWVDSTNNHLVTRDRTAANTWGNPKTVDNAADEAIAPTLITLTSGKDLIAFLDNATSTVKFSTRTSGGNWAAAAALSTAASGKAVSLTALPNGDAMCAYIGTDGNIYTSYFTGATSTWGAIAGISGPGIASNFTPAIARGSGATNPPAATVELAFIATDGLVYHSRYVSGVWTTPVLVGGGATGGMKSVAIATVP